MTFDPTLLMSAIIFFPTVGALFLAFFDRKDEEAMRNVALWVTITTFVLTLFLLADFNTNDPGIQPVYQWTDSDTMPQQSGTLLVLAVYVTSPLRRGSLVSQVWRET